MIALHTNVGKKQKHGEDKRKKREWNTKIKKKMRNLG